MEESLNAGSPKLGEHTRVKSRPRSFQGMKFYLNARSCVGAKFS